MLLILLLWLLGFLFFWKISLINKTTPSPSYPPISIIIPARNEEKNLARLLRSLTVQISPESEIIVVNDHSEDATALIAHNFLVKVINSAELPEGWLGKTWACWQGAQEARNETLLFLDADTFFEPNGFIRLMGAFTPRSTFLSLQPYHRMENPYEQLSAYFNIIVMAGSNAFTVLGGKIKPLGGFGPCMMCRKEDYFRIGGHQVVASKIIEHFILGREFRKAGLEIRCFGGKGVLNFQMYPAGFNSMIQGFLKSFALGSQAISPISLIAISAWITGAMAMTRHLVQSLIFFQATDLITWLVMDLLFAAQLFWMLVRIGTFRWWIAVFFQFPLVFFVGVFFVSLMKTLFVKKVSWKGRSVKTGER